MQFRPQTLKVFQVMLCLVLLNSIASTASAELKLDTVYPTLGLLGQDLEVTLRGTGFDGNTRVVMSLDSGNRGSIIGAVDTPGFSYGVTVVGDIAYVADLTTGLQIIDVSDPVAPVIIGSVDTTAYTKDVFVKDNKAYVASDDLGLQIIDVSDPANPVLTGAIDTSGRADEVYVVWNIAYLSCNFLRGANGTGGLQIIDVSDPTSPQIIGGVSVSSVSDTVISGGKAYMAAQNSGVQIADISDPANPTLLGGVDTPNAAVEIAVSGDRAYVTGKESSFYVIDISNPSSPQIIGSLDTLGTPMDVAVSGSTVYVMGINLQVIDVSDPANPVVIGIVDTPSAGRGIAILEKKAYVADYDSGLQVIDVSNPSIQKPIGSLETPGVSRGITIVNNKAYVVGYGSGLQVIDVADPSTPVMLGSVDTPGAKDALADPAGLVVADNVAYVADFGDGLQVIDVSDPANPVIIGSVDTPGYAKDVAMAGAVIYVADGFSSTLQVVNVNDPANPGIIGSVEISGHADGVAVTDGKAFVAGFDIKVVDVSDPTNPQKIGSVALPTSAKSLTVLGDRVYVTTSTVHTDDGIIQSAFVVVDVSKPTLPEIIGSVELPDVSSEVIVIGAMAYLSGYGGILAIAIGDGANPRIMGSVDTPGAAKGLTVLGDKAYVLDSLIGLFILPLPVGIEPLTVINEASISLALPSPQIAGHYTLSVYNNTEADQLIGAVTFSEPEEFSIQKQKKAIIIAGGGPYTGNYLWDATQTVSNFAYLSLLSQGYTRENIYYLSPKTDIDVDGDGIYNDVDKNLTGGNLSNAIKAWAKDANDVLIFMTDHGGDGVFLVNGATSSLESLTAETLDGWLDDLQATMPGQVVFVYDACQSGSFLPLLIPPDGKDRIVIASSLADEEAWFLNNGVLSFSYQFWTSIFLNSYLYKSFITGNNMVSGSQTPLIDANGNGIGNEKEDRKLASGVIVGRGRAAASTPPVIGGVSEEQTLYSVDTATLWANDIFSLNSIVRVWAVIAAPGSDLGSPDVPVTSFPTVDLEDADNDGKYEGTYPDFTQKGIYEVTIYAMDSKGMNAIPVRTRVNQTVGETTGAALSGKILAEIAGHPNMVVSNASVSLEGTSYTTTTDNNGDFVLENLPSGDYTMVINAPYFTPITQNISLSEGQSLALSLPKMVVQQDCDIDGDGKVGLPEIIYGLQVVSGVRSSD